MVQHRHQTYQPDQRKAERRWGKSGLLNDRQLFVAVSSDVTHLITKRSFYIEILEKTKTCKELFKFWDELLGKQKYYNSMTSGSDSSITIFMEMTPKCIEV